MVDTATLASQLADAPSFQVTRIDGGWLFLAPGPSPALACRTPRAVLTYAALFFGATERIEWEEGTPGSESVLQASKIHNGYLFSAPLDGPLPRAVRFTPRGALVYVGRWLGLSPHAPKTSDPSPGTQENP